jgi:hypothetical protein
VVRLKSGQWRNLPLWEEYQSGRLLLVKRPPDKEGQKLDDLTLIKTATDIGAYVCSNDKFRDHMKDKKLGFLNRKRIKDWTHERKFDFKFHVATGLSEELLAAMVAASGFVARVGITEYRARAGKMGFDLREAARAAKKAAEEGVHVDEEEAADGEEEDADDADEEEEEAECAASGRAPAVPYHVMPLHLLPVVFEPVPSLAMCVLTVLRRLLTVLRRLLAVLRRLLTVLRRLLTVLRRLLTVLRGGGGGHRRRGAVAARGHVDVPLVRQHQAPAHWGGESTAGGGSRPTLLKPLLHFKDPFETPDEF